MTPPPSDRPGGFDPRPSPPPPRSAADPFARGTSQRLPARGGNRIWIILGIVLLLGAALFGWSLTRDAGGDRLGEGDEGSAAQQRTEADPAARCAASATYDLIKRELFRQAAATRGSDQATFDQLATYSALRVTRPVLRERDEGLERVSCGADVALDLPPGLQVVGGRRTLAANLSYSLQPAADRNGDVLTLAGAEGIVVPLATLSRNARPAARTTPPADTIGNPPEPDPAAPVAPATAPPPEAARPVDAAPDRTPPPPAAIPPSAAVRPSFNCARARTRSEIAVCNSPDLAALDREMAGFYQTVYRGADPGARAILERTRGRFLAYRDRCSSDACIADAYRGRISEIRDIVDGRWRGN